MKLFWQYRITLQSFPKPAHGFADRRVVTTGWPDALRFDQIRECKGEQSALGHPQVRFDSNRVDGGKRTLRLDIFQVGQEQVVKALTEYYSRHLAMTQYHKEKEATRERSVPQEIGPKS